MSGRFYRVTRAAFALAAAWFGALVSAHPGGLNAEGCHNDRQRGEYHCHGQAVEKVQRPAPTAPLNLIAPQQKSTASCGSKRYCKEMVSCAEAVHYLYSCGITRLDRDRDGIPCETLCGNNAAGTRRVEALLRGEK